MAKHIVKESDGSFSVLSDYEYEERAKGSVFGLLFGFIAVLAIIVWYFIQETWVVTLISGGIITSIITFIVYRIENHGILKYMKVPLSLLDGIVIIVGTIITVITILMRIGTN